MYGGGVMPGRRAGSGVGKYSADIPKQGQQKVQLYCKDVSLCPSRYIIYLWTIGHAFQKHLTMETSRTSKR